MPWKQIQKYMKRNASFLVEANSEVPNFLIYGHLYRFSKNSLFIFKDTNRFRILLLKISLSKYFDYFITFNIILNSFLLCMYNYSSRLDDLDATLINSFIDQTEFYFTSLFIFEAIIKIVGMGFCLEKNSYLRDYWNLGDFLIVLAGIVAFLPDVPQFSILRCIRMLRPLRSITRIPGMKTVVSALLDSIPHLVSVACVMFIFLLVFGILGMQMFSGLLYNRCRITPNPVNSLWLIDENDDKLCGYRKCPEINNFCDNPMTFGFPVNQTELDNPTFNWGLTSFDNLRESILLISQSITGEGWSPILYIYWNGYNAALTSLFFCAVIIIGNFFLLNLSLAAINSSFIEFNKKENFELKHKKEQAISPLSPLQPTTAKIKERIRINAPERVRKNRFYRICYKISYNPFFVLFSLGVIIINSILLGIYRYPMSQNQIGKIENGLTFCLYYFLFELLIRMAAIGIKTFAYDVENIIEVATVVVGLSNFIYTEIDDSNNSDNFMKAVRALMLLRIVKVMNFFKSIKLIMKTIRQTIWKMIDFLIVIIIFMFVLGLIGMQLFAYRIRFDKNDMPLTENITSGNSVSHRVNFDNFGEAFLTVFALFVGDNWYDYMFDAIRTNSNYARIYFLIVVYLGNVTLVNVFTAILINTFGEESEKISKGMKKIRNNNKSIDYEQFWMIKIKKMSPIFRRFFDKNYIIIDSIWKILKRLTKLVNEKIWRRRSTEFNVGNVIPLNPVSILKKNANFEQIFPKKRKNEENARNINLNLNSINPNPTYNNMFPSSPINVNNIAGILSSKINQRISPANPPIKNQRWSVIQNLKTAFFKSRNVRKPSELLYKNERKSNIFLTNEQSYLNNIIDFKAFNEKVKSARRDRRNKGLNMSTVLHQEFDFMSKIKADYQINLIGVSLNLLDTKNKIRIFCWKILNNPIFESFITCLIVLSCIFLAAGDPFSSPNSNFNEFLLGFDMFLAVIFMIEILIKIIVHGLIFNGSCSYLRTKWHIFDFIISVFFILATLQAIDTKFSAVKSLRFARILRPLRLISKNEGLKLIINSFLMALPTLFNLFLLVFSFFYICSVFLVNIFKGSFYYCSIDSVPDKWSCFDNGGDWINNDFHMDNVLMAMGTLLAISTTDNWMQTMFNMMDSVGINESPKVDNATIWKYFSIIYISISTFVVLNLFTSLVVDSYQREKDKAIGIANLSFQQKEWIKLQRRIFDLKPKHNVVVSKQRLKKKVYKVVQSKAFNYFIIICIILNTIVLCFQPIGISNSLKEFIETMNYIFFAVIILENILKLYAFGKGYFTESRWNIFDLFIIFITFFSIYSDKSELLDSYGLSMSSIQSFRIFRTFKLFNQYKGLKTVMSTLEASLSSLAQIGGLIILVLFVYSIIGMNAFSYVKMQNNISVDANFQSFKIASMTLLRISTGEGWAELMSDFARHQSPDFVCIDLQTYDDYLKYGLQGCGTYWSYLFFFSFEILFIMIVLNLFIAVILQSFEEYTHRSNFVVNDEILIKIKNLWKLFDPKATTLISMKHYERFINILPKPLGIKRENKETSLQYSQKIGIPIYTSKIYNKKKEFFFFFYDFFLAACKKTVLEYYEENSESDFLEPLTQVKLLEKFWRIKMHSLLKIKNLIVCEFDVADYIANMKIKLFLERCRSHYYKRKKLQYFKDKLKSMSSIELPPIQLKKNNSSSKQKLPNYDEDLEALSKSPNCDEIVENITEIQNPFMSNLKSPFGKISTILEEKENES